MAFRRTVRRVLPLQCHVVLPCSSREEKRIGSSWIRIFFPVNFPAVLESGRNAHLYQKGKEKHKKGRGVFIPSTTASEVMSLVEDNKRGINGRIDSIAKSAPSRVFSLTIWAQLLSQWVCSPSRWPSSDFTELCKTSQTCNSNLEPWGVIISSTSITSSILSRVDYSLRAWSDWFNPKSRRKSKSWILYRNRAPECQIRSWVESARLRNDPICSWNRCLEKQWQSSDPIDHELELVIDGSPRPTRLRSQESSRQNDLFSIVIMNRRRRVLPGSSSSEVES